MLLFCIILFTGIVVMMILREQSSLLDWIVLVVLLLIMCSSCTSLSEGTSSNPFTVWNTNSDGASALTVAHKDTSLTIAYELAGEYGWVEVVSEIDESILPPSLPLSFSLQGSGDANFEIKFIDSDGSVFGMKVPLEQYKEVEDVVVYRDNCEYWWGGDETFNEIRSVHFALSGKGKGTVEVRDVRRGAQDLPMIFPVAGPRIDAHAFDTNISFEARRARDLIPENPLVLAYLKALQDSSAVHQALISSQEDVYAQTFNNALCAMVFILKKERERAERILNFYSSCMVKENDNKALQQFYYRGEARGFYQNMLMVSDGEREALHTPPRGDRWMGDNVWLLLAALYYQKTYDDMRYSALINAIHGLMIANVRVDEETGGMYMLDGWRRDDSAPFENKGHAELAIDAYAAFRLLGEKDYAEKIKVFLDKTLGQRSNLWLDNYTWRVLACGKGYGHLLDIPDHDLRFRKRATVEGVPVMGVFHAPDAGIQNMWLDGTGHMACAYFSIGEYEKGNFYANQYDSLLIDRAIKGVSVKALPYTLTTEGGYEWVNPQKGFSSTCIWYIFAKNQFNPLRLEVSSVTQPGE